MVTDQELASCVETLLRQAGPNVSLSAVSVPGVVRHLEAHLGLDLSHKESFIRHQIGLILTPPSQKDRFAPAAFQQFQLHPSQSHLTPAAAAAAAAASSSPYAIQGQQEIPFKFQSPPAAPAAAPPAETAAAADPAAVEAAPAEAKPAAKESAPTGTKRRGGPGGLNKMCGVSPELQAIVGEPTMARTQIVKQLWAYIRKNNLQDPNNKRKIICNDELRLVFETDCTDMFKMNKLLAKHIIPLEPTRNAGSESKKQKRTTSADVVSFEGADVDKYPIVISDQLADFLGAGERKMLRSEALGRVWAHIRSNRLEDPMNGMVILCDSKLQKLFGCESVSALGVSEMLFRHCFQQP